MQKPQTVLRMHIQYDFIEFSWLFWNQIFNQIKFWQQW
jgi:hypothetical protein